MVIPTLMAMVPGMVMVIMVVNVLSKVTMMMLGMVIVTMMLIVMDMVMLR